MIKGWGAGKCWSLLASGQIPGGERTADNCCFLQPKQIWWLPTQKSRKPSGFCWDPLKKHLGNFLPEAEGSMGPLGKLVPGSLENPVMVTEFQEQPQIYIQKTWVFWGGVPETFLPHFGTWMRLLKISTFGVSNGVSPRKPQNCQQLLRSAKVTEVLQLAYTHPCQRSQNRQEETTETRRPQNHAAWERPNYVSSLHTLFTALDNGCPSS